MRPRSPERQQMLQAASTLASGPLQGGTFHQLAALVGLEPGRARKLAENMTAAGELVKVREVRAPHSRRPLACLAPASMARRTVGPADNLLVDVMRNWRNTRW